MAASESTTSRMAGVTDPFVQAFGDLRGKRYPRTLLFSVLSWLIGAVTLITSLIGLPTTTIDDPTEAAVQGVGGQIAPTAQEQWFVPVLPGIGVVMVIAAIVLFVGVGWARVALTVLGILGVVGLAQAALQWQAVVAAVFVVLGAVLSLLVPAHRYLSGVVPEPSGPAPEETSA